MSKLKKLIEAFIDMKELPSNMAAHIHARQVIIDAILHEGDFAGGKSADGLDIDSRPRAETDAIKLDSQPLTETKEALENQLCAFIAKYKNSLGYPMQELRVIVDSIERFGGGRTETLLTFDESCYDKKRMCSSFKNKDEGFWCIENKVWIAKSMKRCPQCKKDFPNGLALVGKKWP